MKKSKWFRLPPDGDKEMYTGESSVAQILDSISEFVAEEDFYYSTETTELGISELE